MMGSASLDGDFAEQASGESEFRVIPRNATKREVA
jgi:hypothetical protein